MQVHFQFLGLWKPAFRGARGNERAEEAAQPGQRQSWALTGAVPGAGISGGNPLARTLIPRCQPAGALRIHTHASLPLVAFVDAHTPLSHPPKSITHTGTDMLSTAIRPSAMTTPSTGSGAPRAHGWAHTDTRMRGTRAGVRSHLAKMMAAVRVTKNPDFHQETEPRGRFSPKTEHFGETHCTPPPFPHV